MSSIKGTTGHALGASGSIEAAVVVESIRRHELPPNIGLLNQEKDIEVVGEYSDGTQAVSDPAVYTFHVG